MSNDDKILDAAKAVEGIIKAVPVYQDTIQPAAKQIGIALETLTKAIHVALAPVGVLVWGYEKISDFLSSKLADKLKNVPLERIVTPNLLVAGPIVESLKFAAHNDTLRELYANLLATSIDSATAHNAHPGFVYIIQNMTPDEAKILKYFTSSDNQPLIDVKVVFNPRGEYSVLYRNFSKIGKGVGCDFQNLLPSYLDNLCRLGLLEIPSGVHLVDENLYKELESDEQLAQIRQGIEIKKTEGWSIGFIRKKIELTDLGKQFCFSCIIDKNLQT